MKVQATIRQTSNGYFVLTVPAIDPISDGLGESVEQAVTSFYSEHHIYRGEFQVRRDVDAWMLSEQDRTLELYVYQGKYNTFHEQVRVFEQQAFKILEAFPGAKAERTADVIQIGIGGYGDETGVIVILAHDLVEVRFPEIQWRGPHSLLSVPKKWQRLEGKKLQDTSLIEFIHAAQDKRRKAFRYCKYCEKSKPAGWMHNQDVCDGCAEKYLGIIH